MAKKYTSQDIKALVEEAKKKAKKKDDKGDKQGNFSTTSDITPFVGKNTDKPVITPGLKLKHRQSGLTYTVQNVDFVDNDVVMTAQSGDGNEVVIPSKKFKFYERL